MYHYKTMITIKLGKKFGFTLIELIVALAVLSVAVTVVVQMFSISVDMSRVAQNSILAHMIAEEKLEFVVNHPEKFKWNIPENYKFGDFFRVLTSSDEPEAGNKVEEFLSLPPEWERYVRYKNVLSSFRWKVLGKLSSPDSNVVEVIVVVSYRESGRLRNYALMSIVPRKNTAVRSEV
ncbi:MAG: prepilin-type N-terminal cleavage/methylation domain-containing protein [Candidatus Hydrogenedentes bacterium]|nr:prepilin-type N-terminal cleavage/methylation domain-containing protein [Candidatus Hydrogenedentota bacterium]